VINEQHQAGAEPRPGVTATEFAALFESVSRWGRWGDGDQRGALNLLTP
jgi:hypothetical protein